MANELTQTAQQLTNVGTSIQSVSRNVEYLSSAFEKFARITQTLNVAKLDQEYNKLQRSLLLTTTAINDFKKRTEELSKSINILSQRELTQMASVLQKSTLGITMMAAEQDKLIQKFSQFYKRDAPEYTARLAQVIDQMPILSQRMKQGVTDVSTLNEVFKRGGPEAVSAYLTAMKQAEKGTRDSVNNMDDSFKKLESSIENMKLKIGKFTAPVMGAVSNFAAENPLTATLGVMAAGYGGYSTIYKKLVSDFGRGGGSSTVPASDSLNTPFINGNRLDMIPGSHMRLGLGAVGAAGIIGGEYLKSQGHESLGGAASTLGYAATGALVGSSFGPIGTGVGAGAGLLYGAYNTYASTKTGLEGYDEAKATNEQHLAEMQERNKRIREARGSAHVGTLEEAKNFMETAKKDYENEPDEITKMRKLAVYQQSVQAYTGRAAAFSSSATAQLNLTMGMDKGQIAMGEGGLDKAQKAIRSELAANESALGSVTADNPEERARIQEKITELTKTDLRLSMLKKEVNIDITKQWNQQTSNQEEALKLSNTDYETVKSKTLAVAQGLRQEGDLYRDLAKKAHELGLIDEERTANIAAQTADIQAQGKLIEASSMSFQKQQMQRGVEAQIRGFKLGGAGSAEALQTKQARLADITERLKDKSITSGEAEQLKAEQRALSAETSFITNQQRPFESMNIGIQAARERRGILGDTGPEGKLQAIQEELSINQELIASREKSLNGMKAEDDLELQKLYKARENLKLQSQLTQQYDLQSAKSQHTLTMLGQQVQKAQLLKNPFMAQGAIREQLNELGNSINIDKQKLAALLTESKGEETGATRQMREQIGNKQLQQLGMVDYQRRTFAEQFTAQALNLPQGSYLNPGISEGALTGGGYFTGQSQFPNRKLGSYQRQMSDILGEGVSERSPWEQLIKTLDEGITINGEVHMTDEGNLKIGAAKLSTNAAK